MSHEANAHKRSIYMGMRLLTNHQWADAYAVIVEDQTIKAVVPENMINHHFPAQVHKFPKDYYLVPGFIDLHVHGAKGKDVMDATTEALISISRALVAEGVTSFLATTMTTDNEHLEKVLTVIAETKAKHHVPTILGVHLEGPFISEKKCGAQLNKQQLPDAQLLQKWQKLANGAIKIVTLAPELPGALDFIKTIRNLGIVASIGHTDATFAETNAAIVAGCTEATHLFNAMRGLHQREPGAVSALLLSDLVTTELIVDGIHLHPAVVELVLRLKHKENILLVTDGMRAKHLGDGQYDLGGQAVDVRGGNAELSNGTLAGSTLRMPDAIKNMQRYAHCSLMDAIEMATINPARILGLMHQKGTIDAGKDADLVILNAEFEVVLTVQHGQIAFLREGVKT